MICRERLREAGVFEQVESSRISLQRCGDGCLAQHIFLTHPNDFVDCRGKSQGLAATGKTSAMLEDTCGFEYLEVLTAEHPRVFCVAMGSFQVTSIHPFVARRLGEPEHVPFSGTKHTSQSLPWRNS